MANQTRVFPPIHSSRDTQSFFLPTADARDLVELGRAERLSKHSIRLIAIPGAHTDDAIVSAAGYDTAVRRTPVTDFRQVWGMRNSGGVDMWQYTSNSKSKVLEL